MADFYFTISKNDRSEDDGEEGKKKESPRSPQFSSVCEDEENEENGRIAFPTIPEPLRGKKTLRNRRK